MFVPCSFSVFLLSELLRSPRLLRFPAFTAFAAFPAFPAFSMPLVSPLLSKRSAPSA